MELKFKVGDKVEFVDEGRKQMGTIIRINEEDDGFPYRVENKEGLRANWFSEDNLKLVEEPLKKKKRTTTKGVYCKEC